ncbi:unnamed protein product [marine sediment metagenome]|uniref:Uncharacterized protein n=1 Tax=marine sediment metagenome TaxID=412755 RepID=X0TXF1_9ZZZZ
MLEYLLVIALGLAILHASYRITKALEYTGEPMSPRRFSGVFVGIWVVFSLVAIAGVVIGFEVVYRS